MKTHYDLTHRNGTCHLELVKEEDDGRIVRGLTGVTFANSWEGQKEIERLNRA